MHSSQEAEMSTDAFILRRAASVMYKHSKRKKSWWLRVLMSTLIDAAKEIEKEGHLNVKR